MLTPMHFSNISASNAAKSQKHDAHRVLGQLQLRDVLYAAYHLMSMEIYGFWCVI